ncbi:MAG: hypothetical protein D4R45_05160, partial [Planctomycetaceae bacterium]
YIRNIRDFKAKKNIAAHFPINTFFSFSYPNFNTALFSLANTGFYLKTGSISHGVNVDSNSI